MVAALVQLFHGKPPRDRRPRERFLLPAEWHRVNSVLNTTPQKVSTYFRLLIYTAARRDEARLMEWCHVDLEEGIWYKPRTKNGKSQLLPLGPKTCQLLLDMPRIGRYVFPAGYCKAYEGMLRQNDPLTMPWCATAVEYWWRKIRRLAGVPDVRIHDLRRTTASWMTMRGENLKIVQSLLDHSDLATTQIYARLDIQSLRSAMERHEQRVIVGPCAFAQTDRRVTLDRISTPA